MRPRQEKRAAALAIISSLAWSTSAGAFAGEPMRIPAAPVGPKRLITSDDLARIRDIDTLSVSPDGQHFVIQVRQAEPRTNNHRVAWFVGDAAGSPLRFIADGGEPRLMTYADGSTGGDFGGSPARWSPDGRSIAFLRKSAGEVQVWTAALDGSGARQVSRNPGDVRDLAWSKDGTQILFAAHEPRAERAAIQEKRNLEGNRLQNFSGLGHALYAGTLPVAPSADPPIFAVNADGIDEHAATDAEKQAYKDSSADRYAMIAGGTEIDTDKISAAFRPPAVSKTGARAWLAKVNDEEKGQLPLLQIFASPSGKEADAVRCENADCTAQWIDNFQWSESGDELLFTRFGGSTGVENSLFAWAPQTGRLRTVADFSDGWVESCTLAGSRLICLRQERLRPEHVLGIDAVTGEQTVLADVNPEFLGFKLGRIQRIEWETPRYPKGPTSNTRGYIIYPPDYDPKTTYPLFVAPYSASGFARGDAGDEHPMLVYAANGFVVLNSEFPLEWELFRHCLTPGCTFDAVYDPKGGYAHLASFADTTFRGMDLVAKHANVDLTRVGIGGVSHGAFIPLYMLQKEDRLAALSVAQGSWIASEYYAGQLVEPWEDANGPTHWVPKDPEFWKPIDFAQHLDKVEAPILFHFADSELYRSYTQVRDMADAHLPFEAYVFPGEYHFKYQPAHKLAVYNRNLDWFRFWLQDYEDPSPAKAEQYSRWRKLRELQCKNKRSTRDLCEASR